jgi:hypothetical protein
MVVRRTSFCVPGVERRREETIPFEEWCCYIDDDMRMRRYDSERG